MMKFYALRSLSLVILFVCCQTYAANGGISEKLNTTLQETNRLLERQNTLKYNLRQGFLLGVGSVAGGLALNHTLVWLKNKYGKNAVKKSRQASCRLCTH